MTIDRRRRTPPTTHVRLGDQTWALVRGAYLSGLSAPAVAARFGCSEGAIRKRAAREGWTKRAHAAAATPWFAPAPHLAASHTSAPAAAPVPAPSGEEAVIAAHLPPPQALPLAHGALSRAAEALRAGDGLKAQRLVRAARDLAEAGSRIDWDERDPDTLDDPTERREMLRLYVRSIAVGLAEMIARGEPLPEGYEDLRTRGEGAE